MALFNFMFKKKSVIPAINEGDISERVAEIRALLKKDKNKPKSIEITFEEFLSSVKKSDTVRSVCDLIEARKYSEAMTAMVNVVLDSTANQLMQNTIAQNEIVNDIITRSRRL